jgi:hypothetical protein
MVLQSLFRLVSLNIRLSVRLHVSFPYCLMSCTLVYYPNLIFYDFHFGLHRFYKVHLFHVTHIELMITSQKNVYDKTKFGETKPEKSLR